MRSIEWRDPIGLSDDEVERRERLVQTYLVVFGLLLSYDHDLALQKHLMMCFVCFLLVSLLYYSILTRSLGDKFSLNLTAFGTALSFSYAFISCYVALGGLGDSVCIMGLFLTVAFLVAFPLLA